MDNQQYVPDGIREVLDLFKDRVDSDDKIILLEREMMCMYKGSKTFRNMINDSYRSDHDDPRSFEDVW